MLVGHRVVGEAGLAVEAGQPGHRAPVGADEVEDAEDELGGGLPGPALDPGPHRLLLEPEPALDDRVARLALDGEQGALLLGILGHHLGDPRGRAQHLELDVRRAAAGAAAGAAATHSCRSLRSSRPTRNRATPMVRSSSTNAIGAQPAGWVAPFLVAEVLERISRARGGGRRCGLVGLDPLQVTTGDHAVGADRGRPGDQDEHQPGGAEDGHHRRRTGSGGTHVFPGSPRKRELRRAAPTASGFVGWSRLERNRRDRPKTIT